MSIIEVDPYVPNAPAENFNLLAKVEQVLGIAPLTGPTHAPAPAPAPPPTWAQAVAALNYNWPGYPWPASFNAVVVNALYADVLGRLAWETQYSYFVGLGQQAEIDALLGFINGLDAIVGGLTGQITAGGSPSQLLADIGNLQGQINQQAANLVSSVSGLVGDIHQLRVYTDARDAQVAATAAANLVSSVNGLVDDIGQLRAYTEGLVAQAEQIAASNLVSSVSGLVDDIGQLRAYTDAQMAGQRNVLEGEISNGVSTAESFAAGAAATAGAQAVATAVGQLQPQIDRVNTDLETCLDPLCDTVTPNAKQLGNLGKLLHGLEDLGVAGLLFGLAYEAVHDPGGAATEVADAAGWVGGTLTDLADAVLG